MNVYEQLCNEDKNYSIFFIKMIHSKISFNMADSYFRIYELDDSSWRYDIPNSYKKEMITYDERFTIGYLALLRWIERCALK